MPNINSAKEQKEIEDIDAIVLAALKMLGGAGGHKQGMKGLGKSILTKGEEGSLYDAFIKTLGKVDSATTILKGIGSDHTHQGNKIVTMQAFRKGLQSIMDDHYMCLKLLEGQTDFNDELSAKLQDPENLKHILQVLGFSKVEIKQINREIEQQKKSNQKSIGSTIHNAITFKHGAGLEDYQADRKKRIQFMISGAQSYIPFSEPNDGCKFKMPIEDSQGNYHRVEMQTNRINMGQGLQGPYYSLHFSTPTNSPDRDKSYAKDITVFMGTNPLPTASGPTATVHADTISGKAVGQNFVETTADQFEKLYKNRFKENLKKLMEIASDPSHPEYSSLRDGNGEIDHEKIWLQARTECVGQSLGGSIPLQMAARFPAFVKLSAFEPPFLLEKDRAMIEQNLENAHLEFGKIVSELQAEGHLTQEGADNLKNAVPKDKSQLQDILKNNNTIITQLIDPVTKYGSVSPPAQIYHVTTDKKIPKYNKVTDKLYKAVMAGSAMSHAMVLSGQSDKKIVPVEKKLDNKMRKNFTSFLHNAVWKVANPPLVAYFHAKAAFQKLYNPKEHASKDPKFNETCWQQLKSDTQGKWDAIQAGLKDLDNPNTHLDGNHLYQKMQELGRMIERSKDWGATDTEDAKASIIKEATDKYSSEKQEIYVNLLRNELGDLSPNELMALQDSLVKKVISALDGYEKAIGKLDNLSSDSSEYNTTLQEIKVQRQEIIQYYPMLNKEKRKEVLSKIDNDIEQGQLVANSAKFGLLNDLKLRAKSSSEDLSLGKLMKKQKSSSVSLASQGKQMVHGLQRQSKLGEGVSWQPGVVNKVRQAASELDENAPRKSKKIR